MKKMVTPPIVAVLILILISTYALFCRPLIGLADNGDFYRIMVTNDLKFEADRSEEDYYGYFNHKYDKLEYYNDYHGNFLSTHSIVIKAAVLLDDLFTQDEKFDIRFLAILYLGVLSLSLYWIVVVVSKMTENSKLKYFFACFTVIMFGDIGYVAYLNSFYGEAVAYVFYMLSIAALMKFALDKTNRIRYLSVFALATFMFIGSKNQFAANGILACVVLAVIVFANIDIKKKIIAVSLGFVLLVSGVFMYFMIDDSIYLINKYHMMNRGVLLFEPEAQSIIKEMGISEQYALLAETIYFDATPVIDPRDPMLLDNFYSKYHLTSVSMYYLTHPEAFSKMMNFSWKNSFAIRPDALGNYERSAGMEYGKKTDFFSLWSYVKGNLIPKYSGFVYLFLLTCLVLGINRFIGNRKHHSIQMPFYIEIIMLYVLLTGFSQILASFIGAGDADLSKHLFMNTLALDILFYFNFTYVLSIIFRKEKI